MTTDELRAAAEEIIRLTSIPNMGCKDRWYNIVPVADKLARHVQRMYDETPCNEAWLKAVGFSSRDGSYRRGCLNTYRFEGPNFAVWFGDGLLTDHAKTRGDVRRLCEALGIELREGE